MSGGGSPFFGLPTLPMPRPAALLTATVLLTALAGCAAPRDGASPSVPPASDAEQVLTVVPVVRVVAGQPDTLALSALLGTATPVRFDPHPDVRLSPLSDGRAVIEARDGFAGLAVVPFRVGGAGYVLAVESVAAGDGAGGADRLRLRFEGVDEVDPTLLRFSVRRTTAAGADAAVEIDEEEGVVALLDNRLIDDNAIDAFDETVVLDLDAAGLAPQRLRVAVRTDGLVSNWVEVPLDDGRPAPGALD